MKATIDRETTTDPQPMAARLAALERMSATELRRRHAKVFCAATRSENRQRLFRRIAWRMQFDAEGSCAQRADEQAREIANQYASDGDIRDRPPKAPPSVKAAEPGVTMRASPLKRHRAGCWHPVGSGTARKPPLGVHLARILAA